MCNVCLDAQLTAQWPGLRMTFGYLRCGVCRAPLAHASISCRLKEHWEMRRQVLAVSLERYRRDGLLAELEATLGGAATQQEEEAHAEEQMLVYSCRDCRKPYCAGLASCGDALEQTEKNERTRCPDCEWRSAEATDRRCTVHGPSFAIYKCDLCCSLAVWECGQSHYCEPCHSGSMETIQPCPGLHCCPLGILHPPNNNSGTAFVFGCTACCGCKDMNEVEEGYANSDYQSDYGDDDDNDDLCLADDPIAMKFVREEARMKSRIRTVTHAARRVAKQWRCARGGFPKWVNERARMRERSGKQGGRRKVSRVDQSSYEYRLA